jgi:uncharacterized protein YkwD
VAKVLRLGLIAAVFASLAACGQASLQPVLPTPTPDLPPATSTPFLPRGFANLPTASLPAASIRPDAPTAAPPAAPEEFGPSAADGFDLSVAVERLNLLRAGDGTPPLRQVATLNGIAQRRAEALAATRSLWHIPGGGQQPEAEGELRSSGYSGQVAEVVLSVGADQEDPLGLVLQALLTDPQNRSLVLGSAFRLAGLGYASDGATWYIVGLLAQAGPND